jgi:hypothetical protein
VRAGRLIRLDGTSPGTGSPFGDHWLMVVGGPDAIQRSFQSYYLTDQLAKQLFTPPPGGEGLYAPWFFAWTPFEDHSSPDTRDFWCEL